MQLMALQSNNGFFASMSSQLRVRVLQRWLRRVELMSAAQMGTVSERFFRQQDKAALWLSQ